MTNRVDELESEIAELRAAVNGLTEELVETKARVRQLEDDAEDKAAADTDSAGGTETTKSDDHVEVVEQGLTATTADEPVESASEGDNPTESQESTDTDDAEAGDIIVA